MQRQLTTLVLAVGLTLSSAAQATLIDRGGGLIYDDVLNITWLQDANYAKTSGHDADGLMWWGQAENWAYNLNYYDGVRNVSYDDWRLPAMIDTRTPGCDSWFVGTDCGYNVETYDSASGTVYSELAYMYYVNLGLKASQATSGLPQSDYGIYGNGTTGGQANLGLIHNLQSDGYWTRQEYIPNTNTHYAWFFATATGQQGEVAEYFNFYAWAVRDGDVAAAVPEPATLGLLVFGLLGLGLARRRG